MYVPLPKYLSCLKEPTKQELVMDYIAQMDIDEQKSPPHRGVILKPVQTFPVVFSKRKDKNSFTPCLIS